jgi:RNA polymerase sigma-54 factor
MLKDSEADTEVAVAEMPENIGHNYRNGTNGKSGHGAGGININPPDIEFGKSKKEDKGPLLLKEITIGDSERVLKRIQHLDPPGLGSRTVQECLIVQLQAESERNPYQDLALEILNKSYDAFSKKHYPVIMKNHNIDEEELRWALEEIRSLNPKPGGLDYQSEMNTVIPDFVISTEDDEEELMISVNDSRVPQLKLSKAYEAMRKEAKNRNVNKETRDWLRGKREDAKFLMQALKQRKNTMLKVMTAIAHFQKNFFYEGPDGLRPLIYKDVAEKTGLDISTVCRIVNGKYVLTPFGTFELKFFFSESLPSEEGEEVSTRIIKNKLKDIIGQENKSKPYSDEKLAKLLKEEGFLVARRTVAKYREQMNILPARMRKKF